LRSCGELHCAPLATASLRYVSGLVAASYSCILLVLDQSGLFTKNFAAKQQRRPIVEKKKRQSDKEGPYCGPYG